MSFVAQLLVGLVALLHLSFLWLEMFAWERQGPRIFRGFSREWFSSTRALAANQGLYNGFLSAGLLWSLVIPDAEWGVHVATFFLGCVCVAGLYGAWTADRKILWGQALPAVLALLALHVR